VAARRHAANEHVFVGGMRLHPQTISQHGTAGERAGGINRHHADCFSSFAHERGELIN